MMRWDKTLAHAHIVRELDITCWELKELEDSTAISGESHHLDIFSTVNSALRYNLKNSIDKTLLIWSNLERNKYFLFSLLVIKRN